MDKKRMASFPMSHSLIADAICLPKGHEIVGAEWDLASRAVRFFVEGPDLPEVECGQITPNILPIMRVENEKDGTRRLLWDWNLTKAST